MWIYLNDAFLSIVADRDDPSRLLVRGRFAGDIFAAPGTARKPRPPVLQGRPRSVADPQGACLDQPSSASYFRDTCRCDANGRNCHGITLATAGETREKGRAVLLPQRNWRCFPPSREGHA